jgi:voltage-dependent calcium channel
MSILLTSSSPNLASASTIDVNPDISRQQPLRSPELSFRQRLYNSLDGLFALPNRPSNSTNDLPLPPTRTWSESSTQTRASERAPASGNDMRSYIRNLSQGSHSQLGRTLPADYLSLPFRLSVNESRDKMRRNMPYLRQGRCRIDLLAIIGFWVTFALAIFGIERGVHHVGFFRALSVLRTVRLLTITSGTTVSRRILLG